MQYYLLYLLPTTYTTYYGTYYSTYYLLQYLLQYRTSVTAVTQIRVLKTLCTFPIYLM